MYVLTDKIKTPIHVQRVADMESGQIVVTVTYVTAVLSSNFWKNLNISVGTVTTLYFCVFQLVIFVAIIKDLIPSNITRVYSVFYSVCFN